VSRIASSHEIFYGEGEASRLQADLAAVTGAVTIVTKNKLLTMSGRRVGTLVRYLKQQRFSVSLSTQGGLTLTDSFRMANFHLVCVKSDGLARSDRGLLKSAEDSA